MLPPAIPLHNLCLPSAHFIRYIPTQIMKENSWLKLKVNERANVMSERLEPRRDHPGGALELRPTTSPHSTHSLRSPCSLARSLHFPRSAPSLIAFALSLHPQLAFARSLTVPSSLHSVPLHSTHHSLSLQGFFATLTPTLRSPIT